MRIKLEKKKVASLAESIIPSMKHQGLNKCMILGLLLNIVLCLYSATNINEKRLADYHPYHPTVCVRVMSDSCPNPIMIYASIDYLHYHCAPQLTLEQFIDDLEQEFIFHVDNEFYDSRCADAIIPTTQMDSLFDNADLSQIINRFFVFHNGCWTLITLRNADGKPVVFENSMFHTKKGDVYDEETNFGYLFYKLQQLGIYLFYDPNHNKVMWVSFDVPHFKKDIEVR